MGLAAPPGDLKRLRAKGMGKKIGKTRCYEPVPERLRSPTALLVMRQKINRPLLTASRQPEPMLRDANPTPTDYHYEALPVSMSSLFADQGIEGEEKGGVEGELGWFRRNRLTPVPEGANLEELNERLMGIRLAPEPIA